MKNLFIVGSKLLGILFVYWALIIIPQIGFVTTVLSEQPSGSPGSVPPEVMLLTVFMAFITSILLAALLLFKTERLSQFLKVPSDETSILKLSFESIIRLGLVLIGVYILIDAMPEITRLIIESFKYSNLLDSFHGVGRLVSLVLRLIMALYIVFYSKHATQIILKYQRAT